MRQTKKQKKNYTNANNNNDKFINVNFTFLSIISIVDILRVQKSTIIKFKECLLEAFNRI